MNEFGSYGSKEEMEAAFAATGAFNDKLRALWFLGHRRAPDLDTALQLAPEGSNACRGMVEVRPFDGLA